MSGLNHQEDSIMDESEGDVTVFDRASRGDEFQWDGSVQEIETDDLQCCSLIVTDLLADDKAMQSTAHI